jgi:hypothetical protein
VRARRRHVWGVALVLFHAGFAAAQGEYFPGPGEDWERRAPEALGLRAEALAEAVAFAQAHEVDWLRDVHAQIEKDVAKEPFPAIFGDTRERGGPAGVILRHGYIVAEWGDVHRPDMTFSVVKSYLSTLVGIAVDRGMIASEQDRVAQYVQDCGFSDPHNAPITWQMLLNQTSEWQGTLWDKPDMALPAAPESSFFALGSGGNMIWVDREQDLVVVTRWLAPSQWPAFGERVMAALR